MNKNKNMNVLSRRISTLFEIFIPIYVIINQYFVFNSVTVGFICIVFFIIIGLFKAREVQFYKPFLLVISLFLLHDLIKSFIVVMNINAWIQRMFFILFICVAAKSIDEERLYKAWRIIGVIVIAGLLYQSYLVYFLHEPVQIIKIFPLPTDVVEEMSYLRPHSFFCEPAVCAIWLIPLLFMAQNRQKIFFSVLITLGILLTTSSTGIIISTALWLYYALGKTNYSTKKKTILILAGIIVVSASLNLDVFQSALQKLMNIPSDSSSFVRLFLGFLLFNDCNFVSKLLGIPFASVNDFLLLGHVSLAKYNLTITSKAFGYVNSLSQSLLLYGIIGTYFYLKLYYSAWKDANPTNKIFVLISFLSIFGQSVFFNAIFVMQFVVILTLDHSNNYIKLKL